MIAREYREEEFSSKRNITKQEILKYLYECIPRNLQDEKYTFYSKTNEIRVGRHLYCYYIRNNKIILTEKRVRNGEIYDVIITPENKKIRKKKLKSKKAKVQSGRKAIFLCGTVLMLSAVGIHHFSKEEMPKFSSTTETYQETEGTFIETLETLENLEIINNLETESITETFAQPENITNSEIISLSVNTNPTDDFGFQKRDSIIRRYGDLIQKEAQKYGLDANFCIDLFSQESHNELDNVSEKEKANMGQLTPVVCTEPIIAPVFENGAVVDYEGYFILPANYPANLQVNSILDIDASYLTDIQKDNLARAKGKGNVNWQVYHKEEVFYNGETNVKVSIAYLSYLVNKKQDLILGAMSYHSGLSKTSGLTREQVVMGQVDAKDASYISNIIRYEPMEFYKDGFHFTILLQNGEIKTYNIKNNILESVLNDEKENGYHL